MISGKNSQAKWDYFPGCFLHIPFRNVKIGIGSMEGVYAYEEIRSGLDGSLSAIGRLRTENASAR